MGERFSDWLTKKMAETNKSQAQLARESGLTRQAISYYLSGKSKQPDAFALQKIAKAFDIPVEHIYREAGILPANKKTEKDIEEILNKVERLSKEDRNVVLEFIAMLDRLRARKK